MMIYTCKTLILALAGFTISIFFSSCAGDTQKLQDCKFHLKNALRDFNAYYRNNNMDSIQAALDNVEQSMKCPQTRYKSIDLKISLLVLSKKYKQGYEFIDSLSENDFSARYKKKMNYDYFRALDYEAKADSIHRDILFNEIVADIRNYIQTHFSEPMRQEP